MALLKRDTHYHTYADYLTWSRSYGDELINGTAYVREPPAPSWLHQEVVVELCRQIANALEGKHCRVCIAPLDVRLPRSTEGDDQVDTVVQPDVLIVSDLKKVDARGICGAPDWVAEVLSPSTASHNRTIKLSAYERAGVREVWLIDPVDRTLSTSLRRGLTDAQPFSNSKDEHSSLRFPVSLLIGPAYLTICRKQRQSSRAQRHPRVIYANRRSTGSAQASRHPRYPGCTRDHSGRSAPARTAVGGRGSD
jgi:Uma2 family endonuclease